MTMFEVFILIGGGVILIKEVLFLVGFLYLKSPLQERRLVYIYDKKSIVYFMCLSLLGSTNGLFLIYYSFNRSNINDIGDHVLIFYFLLVTVLLLCQTQYKKMSQRYMKERS